MDHTIELFTAKYPNVKIDITSSPKLDALLQAKIAANDDNDMFDIFSPFFNGIDEKGLVTEGKVETLEDLWDRELPDKQGVKLKDALIAGMYEAAPRADGKTYKLPVGIFAGGLFYNDNMFTEKGWNKNPKTWDEFVELLDTIKSSGIIPITFPGVYSGYLRDFSFETMSLAIAHANGNATQYIDNYRNLSCLNLPPRRGWKCGTECMN